MSTERAQPSIDAGRMLVTPASHVYDYLKAYAAVARDNFLWSPNTELERGLVERGDPLINLALAQFAGEKEIWRRLYDKAHQAPRNEQDARYLRSLRIACFANESQERIFEKLPGAQLTEAEIQALVSAQEREEELSVLLANPTVDAKFLVKLLKKEGEFEAIEDYKQVRLVQACSTNPQFRTDTSDEHGPDLSFWDLQRAVIHLMRKAPLTRHWLFTLHYLLGQIMRGDSESADDSIEDVLERWSKLPIEIKRDREDGYSEEDTRDETLAMMASLYGHYHDKNNGYKRIVVGDLNSPTLALRCAAYGCVEMTLPQVKEAAKQDGSLFVLAALRNAALLRNRETRAILEEHAYDFTAHVYRDRCQALHREIPEFDPQPVSETFGESFDDTEGRPQQSAELLKIQALETKVATLMQTRKDHRMLITIGFVALGLLIWLSR